MFDAVIRFGVDVLSSTLNKVTNKILLQTGNVVGEVAENDNTENWQEFGFASRPSSPEKGKASAQVITIQRGGRDVSIAGQDVRSLDIYAELKPGETCVYAAGSDGKAQARTIYKEDGSVTHFTTHDNTKAGRSVYSRTSPDGFEWVAPWGRMRFDATGFHVEHASGASFNLGGIAGLPAPFDVISSYVKMKAGVVRQQATIQANGGPGGASLASAPAVIAALDALQIQVAAMQAAWVALGALTGPILGIMFQPIAGPIAGMAAAGVAANAASHETIPTTTTSS